MPIADTNTCQMAQNSAKIEGGAQLQTQTAYYGHDHSVTGIVIYYKALLCRNKTIFKTTVKLS